MKKETETEPKRFTKVEWTNLYELAIEAQDKLQEMERALAADMLMSPQELAECHGDLWEVIGDLTQASIAVDKLTTTMFCAGMAGYGGTVEMAGWGRSINCEGSMPATDILERAAEERNRAV